MSDGTFTFHGQTTFINQPVDTVIQNFQNTYLRGDGSTEDQINKELERLVALALDSRELPDQDKEQVTQALHSVAEQVRDKKANGITLKGTLEAVQKVLSKAADIAGPTITIIGTILKLAGIG